MPTLEDCLNELGLGVVQLAAFAEKAAELVSSSRDACERVSAFLQKQSLEVNTLRILRQGHQAVLQENTELKKELARLKEANESTNVEEPRPKRPRVGDKEKAPSEWGGSQGGPGQYICDRCHRYCGKNAKQCEASIESLLTSSLVDLYSRVVIRGRNDERGELAEVIQEIARRGFKTPEDNKGAKAPREALLAFEKDPAKGVPAEYRIFETTPQTPRVTVEEVPGDEEATDLPAAPAAPKTPEEILPTSPSAPSAPSSGELLQIRREVEGFMSNMTSVLGRLGMSL